VVLSENVVRCGVVGSSPPTPFAPLTPVKEGASASCKVGDLLEIEYPDRPGTDQQRDDPELAAAVSNAGGLGHLAVTWRNLEETRTGRGVP